MRTEERALGLAERLPRHGRRLAGPLCASCLVFAATAGPAVADTFRVTRHDDPPPAGCAPWDCSLREAVNAANGKPGSTIQLSSGTYRLTRPRSLGGKIDSGKPGSDKGDLDVTASAQIATRGSGEVTIDANGGVTGDRVLEVHGGGTVLRGIKLTGGKASVDGDGHGRGGGVRVDAGALYMFGCAVIGNSVPRQGDLGGGIYTADHAVLRRVEVSGNTATGGFGGFGGGVYTASPGATEIYDSKLFADRAFAGGALASEDGHSANVTVARSQIAHNVASGLGGAAYLLGPPNEGGIRYVFENTTINANAADEGGGALRLRNATATLRSSTVVRNTAHNVGGVVARDDGHDRTSVTLGGTILASNTEQNPTPPAAPDCFDETGGLVRSAGYNLIGSADGCEIDLLTLHSGPGDQHGSSQAPLDPSIDPSDHFNGGLFVRAFTHALLPTSRAVNNGGPSGSACPATDARGVPRGDGHCDIGAYELVRCGTRLVNRVGTAGRDSYVTPEMAPTAGSDGVLGFGGNDTLRGADGNDAVCGGPGDDSLSGGAGSDFLTGGSGRDQIAANSGNDTINVRDHERDVVGCGAGDDHVTADGIDQVASDCEHVTRLG